GATKAMETREMMVRFREYNRLPDRLPDWSLPPFGSPFDYTYSQDRRPMDDYYVSKILRDIAYRLDGLAKRDDGLSAMSDRLTTTVAGHSEQIKQILGMLREAKEEREKKAKAASQQAKSEDDNNPFASAVSDGKGQMEMLLRGRRKPRVTLDAV